MENKNNKILWIILGIIVVVGVLVWWMNKNSAPLANDNAGVVEVTPTEDTSAGSVNVGSPAASISYQNALVKYKDARFQLDKTCQGNPDRATFKNGANIMIDNRASVARTVKVGSTFSIKPYGFKIVKLESATLPATWYIDCDGSQNVATILIQK